LENLKARVATFNLNGKASIWWEDLKNVKGIHEEDLSWERFEKYFRKKYLSEKYFDEKSKEFYEHKLGQRTIEEYVSRFLELLRYVPYIKVEKAKVQRFISGLPKDYQNRIEFDEPKTLEDTIRKARYFMSSLGIGWNLVKAGSKRIVWDSRKRGLNPQDLKTIKRTQG
jgi:hypothetical protein